MRTMKELNQIVQNIVEVRSMIKQLQEEEELLKDEIKAEMVDIGEEVIEGDGWTASWINVNNRRFDSKAFKADHADMYESYMKCTTGTRFNLTI